MKRYIDLLAVLFLGWGALGVLVGLSLIVLAVGAAALGWGDPAATGGAIPVAAGVIAATFSLIGVLALAWAAVHSAAGLGLRRGRRWSRPLGLALGIVNLILLPFGTALGVFALWVLLSAETRRLLEA